MARSVNLGKAEVWDRVSDGIFNKRFMCECECKWKCKYCTNKI